ncbi:MAG: DivIVA domain-containing protein [Clostridiales bacterium]|nr:DivIVA domain-containing protein [Clostridiales bacterium]
MKDFTIVRKGFDTTEVDSYIVDLENELKKKDQLIEEYRDRENAINKAVIEAQLTADSIIAKAREDAAHIRSDVTAELGSLREDALRLRGNLIEFQESYNRLLRRYLYNSHCEDMNQIFDRLSQVLSDTGVDLDQLSPLPEVQGEPQEGRTHHFVDQSPTTRTGTETDAHFNLDEMSNALIDSKI